MHSRSQNLEDLFVMDLFKKKNIHSGFFFEFGAWDGIHLSNCRLLFENGWSGCFAELDRKKFEDLESNYKNHSNIILINDRIDPETKNINKIIQEYNIKEINVLSIDVDGRDLSIWKSLEALTPDVVIIEFNPTIPFDTIYEQTTTKFSGNSFLAIDNFAKTKNYELIKVTKCNLIYVKKEFNNKMFESISSEKAYSICEPLRVGFNNYGEYLFFYNHKLDSREIFKSPYSKSFIAFQPIPKFLRNLTNVDGQGGKFLKRVYSLSVLLLLRPTLFIKHVFEKVKYKVK